MAQSFSYEVRYLPETEDIYIIELVSKDGSRKPMNYEQDSTNWINLLSRQKSFRFDGKNGNLSALREQRKSKDRTVRGKKAYWSSYRKAHNAQAKKYIGQDLSIASLEKAAAALKYKLGIDPNDKLHNTRRLQAASHEKQKIAYLLDQNEKLTTRNQEQEKTIKRLEAEIKEKDQIIHHLTDQKTRSRSKSKEAL
jgi:hypothetical protein